MAPAHLLGVAVGGVILLTNSRTLFRTYDVPDMVRIVSYLVILLVTLFGLYVATLRARKKAPVTSDDPAAETV